MTTELREGLTGINIGNQIEGDIEIPDINVNIPDIEMTGTTVIIEGGNDIPIQLTSKYEYFKINSKQACFLHETCECCSLGCCGIIIISLWQIWAILRLFIFTFLLRLSNSLMYNGEMYDNSYGYCEFDLNDEYYTRNYDIPNEFRNISCELIQTILYIFIGQSIVTIVIGLLGIYGIIKVKSCAILPALVYTLFSFISLIIISVLLSIVNLPIIIMAFIYIFVFVLFLKTYKIVCQKQYYIYLHTKSKYN